MDNNEKKLNIVDRLRERTKNAKASKDTGLINQNTGSSVVLNGNGNVTIAASKNVQYKMQYSSGTSMEISTERNTVTHRKKIHPDELVFNKHKLNQQLYELTNMKKYLNDPTTAIGNLTMSGTVLVKAWEPTLQKWVLIRRSIRTPIFSNLLNIPIVPDDMDIEDNIEDYIKEMQDAENNTINNK